WRSAGRIGLHAVRASPTLAEYLFKLRGTLTNLAPDIIHSNGIKAHLLTALVRPTRAKLVWHIHDFLGERPLVGTPLRFARRRVHLAVANSNAVADDARKVLPGLPVDTVYNAIDTDHFSPGTVNASFLDDLAGLAPAPLGTLRVGLVATYGKWKGHDVFL